MTSDDNFAQFADQVRRLEQRFRRLTLLFVVLLVGMLALVAYMHFGKSLGWNPSVHELKANHLVVRTIDFVDLDGAVMCHIYAHQGHDANDVDMDIRSERAKALITLHYSEGKAKIAWSGAAGNWKARHEIGKQEPAPR